MDTRITPFGDHPDGGKIVDLKEGEPIPDHMMPVSEEARKILESVPQEQRMDFILHSIDPKLRTEREWLINKLRKQNEVEFLRKILLPKEGTAQ